MADKDSHPIRNSVIASLVVAAILAAFSTVRGWAVAAWNALTGWVYQLWLWLVSTYETPAWLLLVLVAFSALFIIPRMLNVLRRAREPTYLESYTSDRLFGAVWRWRYVGQEICDLWCCCPRCETQLVYLEGRSDHMRPSFGRPAEYTAFICENCNNSECCRLDGDKGYALNRVQREIDRKIRTDEWKSAFRRVDDSL